MAAPKGHTYWKLAKGFAVGAARKYTPEELWDKAVEYFKWVEDNPLAEEKVFGNGKRMRVSKMRAMTITEFCIFATMDQTTFRDYGREKTYAPVISRIRDVIFSQKFTGAAAGLLEGNIISRELGLIDRQDITSGGDALTESSLNDLSLSELLEIRKITHKGHEE